MSDYQKLCKSLGIDPFDEDAIEQIQDNEDYSQAEITEEATKKKLKETNK